MIALKSLLTHHQSTIRTLRGKSNSEKSSANALADNHSTMLGTWTGKSNTAVFGQALHHGQSEGNDVRFVRTEFTLRPIGSLLYTCSRTEPQQQCGVLFRVRSSITRTQPLKNKSSAFDRRGLYTYLVATTRKTELSCCCRL